MYIHSFVADSGVCVKLTGPLERVGSDWETLSPDAACMLLRRQFQPGAMSSTVAALRAHGVCVKLSSHANTVTESLRMAMERGSLRVFSKRTSAGESRWIDTSTTSSSPTDTRPSETPVEPARGDLVLQLVDERMTPIAGVTIEFQGPMGKRLVDTDSAGMARVEQVPEGTGRVRIPTLSSLRTKIMDWVEKPMRTTPFPTDDSWSFWTPATVHESIPVHTGHPVHVMLLTRVDIVFEHVAYKSRSPRAIPDENTRFSFRDERLTIQLHADGSGRATRIELQHATDGSGAHRDWFEVSPDKLLSEFLSGSSESLSSLMNNVHCDLDASVTHTHDASS